MNKIVSEYNKLERLNREYKDFIKDVNNGLNLTGLSKLPPFLFFPDESVKQSGVNISYNAYKELQSIAELHAKSDLPYPVDKALVQLIMWFAYVSEGVIMKHYFDPNLDRQVVKFYHAHDKGVPVYIKIIYDSVNIRWKNSLLQLNEQLPFSFSFSIKPKFNLKKERKEILKFLADSIIHFNSNAKNKIDKIIESTSTPFKKAIDNIVSLTEQSPEVNYSFCLACEKLLHNKKYDVCPRKDTSNSYKPWNCRNKLNSRIRARLGIKDKEEVKEKRDELYNDLQNYLLDSPLYGLEEFKKKYQVLYTRKKRKSLQRKSEGR